MLPAVVLKATFHVISHTYDTGLSSDPRLDCVKAFLPPPQFESQNLHRFLPGRCWRAEVAPAQAKVAPCSPLGKAQVVSLGPVARVWKHGISLFV